MGKGWHLKTVLGKHPGQPPKSLTFFNRSMYVYSMRTRQIISSPKLVKEKRPRLNDEIDGVDN